MGKYGASQLHNIYSDFHWNLIKLNKKFKSLYITDLDRLWTPIDYREGIVAVIDLKWKSENIKDNSGEKRAYAWFNKQGIPVYILRVQHIDSTSLECFFIVENAFTGERITFDNAMEYGEWEYKMKGGVR